MKTPIYLKTLCNFVFFDSPLVKFLNLIHKYLVLNQTLNLKKLVISHLSSMKMRMKILFKERKNRKRNKLC